MRSRLALVLLAACGSSNNNTSPDAAITSAMACMESASTRCEKLQSCSPADLQKRFGDLATCEARDTLACTEAEAAPMTGNTPATALSCAAAISSESCADFFQKVPPAACTTQVGTLTAACGFAAQCTSSFCAIPSGSQCGTCAPQPVAGDSCATIGCGQDLVCVASTSLCEVPVASGGACNRGMPCADGFTCVGATTTPAADGTCMAEVATSGATCDAKHKTGADCSADAGLACNTTTSMCVAQPLVAAGMPCGVIGATTTRCLAGATCELVTGTAAGTCVAPAADGAACDTAAGPGCLTPARCIPTTTGGTAGMCTLPGSTSCP